MSLRQWLALDSGTPTHRLQPAPGCATIEGTVTKHLPLIAFAAFALIYFGFVVWHAGGP